ncbi:MAG: hypothetical protein M1829_005556 [Trizodia sp. TS-e1964]|nr:MAG: hypothetical protein M1829_005556 [Trizodia sp. TS-e1964]
MLSSRTCCFQPLLRPVKHFTPKVSRGPRPFTHISQLLLATHSPSRPQLPFLLPPKYSQTKSGPIRLARLISTENKQYIKEQLWLGGKYALIFHVSLGVFGIFLFIIHHEWLERQFPSPPGWSLTTRFYHRLARSNDKTYPNVENNLPYTGYLYQRLLTRLEARTYDGAGLKEHEDGTILVDLLGKSGLDITEKSEAWRKGYYEALMGLCRTAENLDGWVVDNTRNFVFPPAVVIGPSNPKLRPTPPNTPSAPLEENCSTLFEPPDLYYKKILTTKGFTHRDLMLAAIAYANWLAFKQSTDAAEEVYRCALDFATSSYSDPGAVIDRMTGILKEQSNRSTPILHPTQNLLQAATSLGIYHARQKHYSSALPIFLSILRARRSLPDAPILPPSPSTVNTISNDPPPESSDPLAEIGRQILSLFQTQPYPPPPPSGDEIPTRTAGERCEEAGLMAYIGEVLYASSSLTSGLTWTRDAVDVAENEFVAAENGGTGFKNDPEGLERCKECLNTSLMNWREIVENLAIDERRKERAQREKTREKVAGTQTKEQPASKGWGWAPKLFWHADEEEEVRMVGTDPNGNPEGKWAREMRMVVERIHVARSLVRQYPAQAGSAYLYLFT